MRSMPRLHNELIVLLSSAVVSQSAQPGRCSEIVDNQRRCEAVNTEFEGSTALEAITRRLVKTQQSEKT
jgi:hypothetical protein